MSPEASQPQQVGGAEDDSVLTDIAAADSGSSPKRGLRSLLPLLQILLGLGLLAFVAKGVPWRDQLILTIGEATASLEGEIVGDWKSNEIHFQPDLPKEQWPQGFVQRILDLDGGGPDLLEVQRTVVGSGSNTGDTDGTAAKWDWRPGMPRVFRDLEWSGIALCFLVLLIGQCAIVTRWHRLLAVAGAHTSWSNALRLNFIGLFFNQVLPAGLTGGDVVKSVIVAKENPEAKAGAFLSVYVDRILGLFALALIAAAVILWQGEIFASVRTPVLVFLGVGAFGLLGYGNRRLRKVLGIDWLLQRLPFGGLVKKLDEALLVYSKRPMDVLIALLLSCINHVASILGVLVLGRAFGDVLPAAYYFAVAPIGNTISALPISPAGWGVGEAAFGFLFNLVGGMATMGIAVSITFRLCMLVLGLLGGVFLLLPDSSKKPA